MKTLDEVIKANECCDHGEPDSRCEDCPYNGIGACCAERETDALHYLKDYREQKETLALKQANFEEEIDRYQEAVMNCEEAENKYRKAEQDALKALDDWASRPVEENKKLVLTVANPPLTWDELKAMKGKPIWVEDDIDRPEKSIKCWTICRGIEKTQITEYALLCDFCYDKAEYGKTWQVYRKEKV